MEAFLSQHSFDAIFITHLFAAEILARLKDKGYPLPKIVYIVTAYACIPFTEEIDCDFIAIPHKDLKKVFEERGIPAQRRVRSAF